MRTKERNQSVSDAEKLNLSIMNNTALGSLSPKKDVVPSNPFQKKEINKISLSSDLVNSNTGKYATLPTRYIQRPQSCFVTSKDTSFKSLDVILECSPQKVKMKQTINTDDVSSDMAQLKAAAARLKLSTKRPSYVAWQAKAQERSTILKQAINTADCLTKERKAWISNTLRWIAQELIKIYGWKKMKDSNLYMIAQFARNISQIALKLLRVLFKKYSLSESVVLRVLCLTKRQDVIDRSSFITSLLGQRWLAANQKHQCEVSMTTYHPFFCS